MKRIAKKLPFFEELPSGAHAEHHTPPHPSLLVASPYKGGYGPLKRPLSNDPSRGVERAMIAWFISAQGPHTLRSSHRSRGSLGRAEHRFLARGKLACNHTNLRPVYQKVAHPQHSCWRIACAAASCAALGGPQARGRSEPAFRASGPASASAGMRGRSPASERPATDASGAASEGCRARACYVSGRGRRCRSRFS